MRRIALLILVWIVTYLAGCGPSGGSDDADVAAPAAIAPGTTGFTNEQDVPFITGGNQQFEEALKNPPKPVKPTTPTQPSTPPAPSTPVAPTPAAPKSLAARLKEFEISRFNQGQSNPSRFGDKRLALKIFFANGDIAEFKENNLQGSGDHYSVQITAGRYTLSGKFSDKIPLRSEGDFLLTDTTTGEVAQIIYSAYKVILKVRRDQSKAIIPGSTFENQLKGFENTFGWNYNWLVVHGPAFYLVDIVKQVKQGDPSTFAPPMITIKGQSLRTGDQDHPAVSLNPELTKDVSMIGNSEYGQGRRLFETKLEDPQSQETNDIVLDMKEDTGQPAAPDQTSEDDDDDTPPPADVTTPAPPPPAPLEPPAPHETGPRPPPPAPVAPPPAPSQPDHSQQFVPGDAYLRINMTLPRTARMSRDFERNRNLRGVQTLIAQYQGKRKNDLNRFYFYANPFRKMIEDIGQAYDVSPTYAYLTIIESSYFTGGKYFNRDRSSVALGIFQFKADTAASPAVGMHVSGGANDDERYYFAPSACGAAKYIRQLVDQFPSDTTVAILGYNQGQGGAAAAIYCTIGGGGGRGCADRINRGMSGQEYATAINRAKTFHFTYALMERTSALPPAMADYVNRKLAIYFISSNMSEFGFRIDPTAPRSFPANNSVFPPQAIKDSLCSSTVSSFRR